MILSETIKINIQSYKRLFIRSLATVAICLSSTNAIAAEYQRSYPITGSSMQELVDQIAQNSESPSGAFGYTKLSTDLSWKSVEEQDGICSVESVEFTYDITIYMPEWVDIHLAKQCLQDNWNKVWHQVQLHEEQHRRLYRLLNTTDINRRISAIEPQNSCENLKARVHAEMQSIFDANDKLHDLFHAADTPPTLKDC